MPIEEAMMKAKLFAVVLTVSLGTAVAVPQDRGDVRGNYLEVRSCDVYTGPCFANGEMGLSGKEAILVWKIDHGSWNDTVLDGLSVVAVIETDATIGDVRYHPRAGRAVLITDSRANRAQEEALRSFVKSKAGRMVDRVVATESAPIDARFGNEASVEIPDRVHVATRAFNESDHLCGNERVFYPPMTEVTGAAPVFTKVAAYQGSDLGRTWENFGQRSGFVAAFAE